MRTASLIALAFMNAATQVAPPAVAAVAPVATAPAAVQARAREIFRNIIAIPTVEGRGKVPQMAAYLADQFKAGGFPAQDIHVLPVGETAALVVRYRGDGSGGRPIVLLAHMDVVEARREDWERDPFTLAEENGYFFGRGTSDIKGDIALITTTFLRLRAEGFKPKRDLIIAFTGDEETRQQTTRSLVNDHKDLVDAEFALNGDGGGGTLAEESGDGVLYYVQGAEKTYADFVLTVHNPGGHSSQPRLDNAIYRLADALKAVQAYRFPVMWNDWTLGSFRASAQVTPGAVGAAMRQFAENPRNEAAAEVLYAEPSYVGMTRTTCVATKLAAGHAENALPQTATANINCRIFPGVSADEVQATLARLSGDGVEVKSISDVLASDSSPMRKDIMSAVERAVHASYPRAAVAPQMAAYSTDGSVLRAGGIPTYGVSGIFMKNSDSFAHGLNERISVAAFYNGLTHWYVLIKDLAGR